MADVEIKLTGFKELGDTLRSFGAKIAANGLRAATFAGAAVIREATKRSHPEFRNKTGTLEAAIIAAKRRSTDEAKVTYRVTVRKAKKTVYTNNARNRALKRVGKRRLVGVTASVYGRFLEFGTSRMPAHPFLRPAFIANQSAALEAMKARLAKAIEQAARAAKKK